MIQNQNMTRKELSEVLHREVDEKEYERYLEYMRSD